MNAGQIIRMAIVLVLPIAVMLPGPAAGMNFVVDSLTDSMDDNPGDGICAAANGSGCTLRAAIQEANSIIGIDSIKIAVTGVIQISLPEYSLRVRESVVIAGPGASRLIIEGRDRAGIFEFDSSGSAQEYVLAGVALTAGQRSFGGGGALYLGMGDRLEIESCRFFNNATGLGGAIRSDGGNLQIRNSQFDENHAQGGGAIWVSSAVLSIKSSEFNRNGASGGGGAVAARFSTVEIDHSTFSNNTSGFKGGALTVQGGGLTVLDSTLVKNSADDFGGAIAVTQGNLLQLIRSTVVDNRSDVDGGGIYNDSGQVFMLNSTLVGNKAKQKGGGLYDSSNSNAWIRNSTFHKNRASSGGGVFMPPNSLVRNTIIAGNQPDDCNGPVSTNWGNLSSDGSCGFSGDTDQSNTDPRLGMLADNGGPTETLGLLPGSTAINRGRNISCPEVDQRGQRREQTENDICDIGAFEVR